MIWKLSKIGRHERGDWKDNRDRNWKRCMLLNFVVAAETMRDAEKTNYSVTEFCRRRGKDGNDWILSSQQNRIAAVELFLCVKFGCEPGGKWIRIFCLFVKNIITLMDLGSRRYFEVIQNLVDLGSTKQLKLCLCMEQISLNESWK